MDVFYRHAFQTALFSLVLSLTKYGQRNATHMENRTESDEILGLELRLEDDIFMILSSSSISSMQSMMKFFVIVFLTNK